MPQYQLNASNFTPQMVGDQYHVGLGDGTHSYGYMLQNWGGQDNRSSLNENTDVTSKSALVQSSSPNLIDRDLVFYPRVSQGDFSGGGLQIVAIDPTKYLDSDLDTTRAGYLQLLPQVLKATQNIGARGANYQQLIWYNSNLYATFGEASGTVYGYNPRTNSFFSGSPAGVTTIAVLSDNATLFLGQLNGIEFDTSSGNLTSFSPVATSVNGGGALKWWVTNQGTNGRFLYYTVRSGGRDLLYSIDLTASFPVAPGSQPNVPTKNMPFFIQDLTEYGTGIALLTTDSTTQNGFDVWQHDGVNMTRVVRVDGYRALGMCSCMGNLYITAEQSFTFGGPILFQVSGSSFQIVSNPAMPESFVGNQYVGQPRAAGQYVFWPAHLLNSPLALTNGSYFVPRTAFYNVLTQAQGFIPNFDNLDWGAPNDVLGSDLSTQRNLAVTSNSVAYLFVNSAGTQGAIVYQSPASQAANLVFQTTGWMVSSRFDFETPGVAKRFRRVEINHAPLNAGESITVKVFIDLDPTKFTPTLAPYATTTNSTPGSTATILTMGASTVAFTLYFAVQLHAGTGNLTTPVIYYTAIEIGGTWSWDFDLDCTSVRRTLRGMEDPQGVTGKDLYFLLRNAYENGTTLTLYLAQGQSYNVNVESMKAQAFGYVNRVGQQPVQADQEWHVHCTLRQIL